MKFQLKGNFINNEFIDSPTSGLKAVETIIERHSPADTSELLWKCPVNYDHIDLALNSVGEGFKVWRLTSMEERIQKLEAYKEVVTRRADEIAEAIAMETGKPLWEAKTEAAALAGKVNVTIKDSLPRINNKYFEGIQPNTDGHIFYKPLGPSFIIGPFNFPCHLANGQITSALIAGNSVIFKPSEKTCYSAQLMIECYAEAGFPPGVINMIQGDGETARRILESRIIKGVFFTGSKEVGVKILGQTHHDLSKLVSLELGGKNTTIIHNDADLEHTMGELIRSSFLTAGQRCTSTAIVAIHRDIADSFIEKFHNLAKKIIVDHPIDHEETPFMGPLIDQRAVDNYLNFMGMAKREGITEIMRGKKLEKTKNGHYVTPSIHRAEKFDQDSYFLTSEIFGPNCTFIPYDTIDEAIEIANSTEYGLAAAVFTKDKGVYQQCLRDVDSGLLNLNRSTVGAASNLPFGGVKSSGNYRPAAVTTIDACVYQQASLEIEDAPAANLDNITGIKKD